MEELIILVDFNSTFPLDVLNMPSGPFSGVRPANYWSATTLANGPTFAWFVNFDFGNVNLNDKHIVNNYPFFFLAWCVR